MATRRKLVMPYTNGPVKKTPGPKVKDTDRVLLLHTGGKTISVKEAKRRWKAGGGK